MKAVKKVVVDAKDIEHEKKKWKNLEKRGEKGTTKRELVRKDANGVEVTVVIRDLQEELEKGVLI